eukprot:173233-Prorocentrum_minimum.AAC.1
MAFLPWVVLTLISANFRSEDFREKLSKKVRKKPLGTPRSDSQGGKGTVGGAHTCSSGERGASSRAGAHVAAANRASSTARQGSQPQRASRRSTPTTASAARF